MKDKFIKSGKKFPLFLFVLRCRELKGSILKVGDNPLFQGKFSIAFRFEKLEFEFGWPALLYVLFLGGILSKEC